MRRAESREVGHDALDDRIPQTRDAGRWRALLPARRVALGLGATATPSLTFVLVGVVLGPHALGVISGAALSHLDAVVSVALAMLGVFIGLGLGAVRSRDDRSLLAAASLEATITITVVAAAMYVLLTRWELALPVSALLFALALGVCACPSAALTLGTAGDGETSMAARLAELDDVPLIVVGSLVVCLIAGPEAPLRHLLLTAAAGGAVGGAGWLLFERANGDAERGVFVTGTIVLLGGAAAYLGASPLLSGCIAALVWVRAPGAADRIIAADLRKLQHPLVALLLIVAGALIEWSLVVLWIAAPLVLFRLSGKLLASAAAARMTSVTPTLLASVLVPPGVIGIALALNVQQVLEAGPLIVSSVTIAAVASELLAVLLLGQPEEAV